MRVSGKQGQPVVFQSEVPHAAIIDGADLVRDFKVEAPGVWSFSAPNIQKNPYWDDGSFGEWVYVEGAPLERVVDKGSLRPGAFWEDYEAKRVLVAPSEDQDIKTLQVEFATRDGLLSPAHRHINTVERLDDVHLIGFTIQHNADWFGGRPALNFRGLRWLIENNLVRWSSWSGISSEGTNGCIIRNNVVDWSGIEAISGTANSHLLVENNKFLHGNWRRGNPNFTGGCSKWALTIDSMVRGNEVAYNYGYGLWFDIHNVGDILEGNICHDNLFGCLRAADMAHPQRKRGFDFATTFSEVGCKS